jgi:hypothetical protein
MTIKLAKTILPAFALLLFTSAATIADESKNPPVSQEAAPAAAEQHSAEEMGCAAEGKCCGSSACAEAKRKSLEQGKAAMAECPCQKNRAKPKRMVQ